MTLSAVSHAGKEVDACQTGEHGWDDDRLLKRTSCWIIANYDLAFLL